MAGREKVTPPWGWVALLSLILVFTGVLCIVVLWIVYALQPETITFSVPFPLEFKEALEGAVPEQSLQLREDSIEDPNGEVFKDGSVLVNRHFMVTCFTEVNTMCTVILEGQIPGDPTIQLYSFFSRNPELPAGTALRYFDLTTLKVADERAPGMFIVTGEKTSFMDGFPPVTFVLWWAFLAIGVLIFLAWRFPPED